MSYNLVVMENYVSESFGKELRRRRKDFGWTQEDLALKSGLSVSYISTIEREQPHSQSGAELRPEPDKIEKLATALKWKTDDALDLAGYARKDKIFTRKPETVSEFISLLEAAGLDLQFDADFSNFTPDDFQDLLDDIKAKLFVKSQRRKTV